MSDIRSILLKLYSLLPHSIRMFIGISKKIQGKNNRINIKASHCKNVRIIVNGNMNEILIAEGCLLRNVMINITGNNNRLELKEDVVFYDGGELNLSNNYTCITIGQNSEFYFGSQRIEAAEDFSKITIGKDCLFSNNVSLKTSDYHSILDLTTRQRINKAKDIYIGDRVWVTPGVILLKGTKISDDSVVATRAVVTRSFEEPNVIIAGCPAKIVKKNVRWTKELI